MCMILPGVISIVQFELFMIALDCFYWAIILNRGM